MIMMSISKLIVNYIFTERPREEILAKQWIDGGAGDRILIELKIYDNDEYDCPVGTQSQYLIKMITLKLFKTHQSLWYTIVKIKMISPALKGASLEQGRNVEDGDASHEAGGD